jgi:hypothetical protein
VSSILPQSASGCSRRSVVSGAVADEEVAERRFGFRQVRVVFEQRKTGEIVIITVVTRRIRGRDGT